MFNKMVTAILIILVILMGGVGYYSYTLSQQLDDLGERLTAFETKQTALIDEVNRELADFRTETSDSIDSLEGTIAGALAEINTLEGEIEAMQEEIVAGASRVDALEDDLAGLAGASIDASGIYQQVGQAVVRISNGEVTLGSGVIYDDEAHVVTAYHVIEDVFSIHVILHDGRVLKAAVVGSSPLSDIAVLKLNRSPGIEPPPLADSGNLNIGEPVVVIGSPANAGNLSGLKDTVTSGIISNLNRYTGIQYDTESRWIANLIQFDAPVNFGNSGCPLFNADGEIAGIVIARIPPTEGDGIYWAVASNKVARVAASLIARGSFDYPWLGIAINELTPQTVQDTDLDTVNGVMVEAVFTDSPAKSAGIEPGDIIVAMDGVPINNIADLTSYLGEFTSPGDTTVISLLRGTSELKLPVEVGKQ